jgi:hypothetical protein
MALEMKTYEQLQLENSLLSKQVNRLWRENQELNERIQYTIPKTSDVTNSSWEVPLVVGYPSLKTDEYFADYDPFGPKNYYRLHFRKEWSNEGCFWRLDSFASKPEKPVR